MSDNHTDVVMSNTEEAVLQQPIDVVMSNTEEAVLQQPDDSKINNPKKSPSTSSSTNIHVPPGSPPKPSAKRHRTETLLLDCYPYTFSPLLLFSDPGYFDKGYSNYNSVAKFFEAVLLPLGVDMLSNVLYDRKNMTYDVLFQHVTKNRMFVPCCIDAHCTAFQVVGDKQLIYYDPLNSAVKLVDGQSYDRFMGYLLIKCNLGNSQHMVDNKGYYKGENGNRLKTILYDIWDEINKYVPRVYKEPIPLDLDTYLMINNKGDPTTMSTQRTGNTCYFQTYLFAILCKVGTPSLSRGNRSVTIANVDKLAEATVAISKFLLEFFVQDRDGCGSGGSSSSSNNNNSSSNTTTNNSTTNTTTNNSSNSSSGTGRRERVMRPLTNSNFVADFYRFRNSAYFNVFTQYLQHLRLSVPDYVQQYIKTMQYLEQTKTLHMYNKFSLTGAMSSTLNTKSLQYVMGTDDASYKLAGSNYYKYRASNFMFGFNAGIIHRLSSFCQFNSLRKNQLLAFYEDLRPLIHGCIVNKHNNEGSSPPFNKFRDYYFMGQFEIGQQELVDIHHYTYLLDMCALSSSSMSQTNKNIVGQINRFLSEHILYSTQRRDNYDKLMTREEFRSNRNFDYFEENFMSTSWLSNYIGLGFAEVNPKEKDINSLTQTVFYSYEMMRSQQGRMEYEFEKECINQMARSNLRKYARRFDGKENISKKYKVSIKIGHGHTYSKYNTLMHFLNVMECYWQNPDLNNIQVFGKDIRTLLAISCQKIFFEKNSTGWYHYGVFEKEEKQSYSSYSSRSEQDMDLAVASNVGYVNPGVIREEEYSRNNINRLVLTDRVYEYHYIQNILKEMFQKQQNVPVKSDNVVLNLCLLSLMLDFGLYEQYGNLLNLPNMQSLKHLNDKRQLQVEIANMIHEFDRKNNSDTVSRIKVESLIFEASYKFIINKGFDSRSKQNALIQQLNADPAYQQHLLLCKVNLSLCQINKSVEVDYYKLKCNGKYRTIIPNSFSKSTGDYLEEITKRYTFSENNGIIVYDDLPLFDLRLPQPEIDLYKVRFDSPTEVQSYVKYVEIKNAFQTMQTTSTASNSSPTSPSSPTSKFRTSQQQCLVFIADNALLMEVSSSGVLTIRINKIPVEIATIYFNEAISFVPCCKYMDSEDVILFCSPNIRYLVDKGGQFATDYYGMKHELMECIESDECFIDMNDEHVFKMQHLNTLTTESKVVVYFPDFLLQVPSRQVKYYTCFYVFFFLSFSHRHGDGGRDRKGL